MEKQGKRQEGHGNSWLPLMGALGKGSAAALIIALILLLFCSVMISAGWLGENALEGGAMGTCVLGALAGAAAAIRGHRELSLPLGIGTGALLFLLLFAGGVLFYDTAPQTQNIPEILLACLCGGGVAGVLGRKTKKKHRR